MYTVSLDPLPSEKSVSHATKPLKSRVRLSLSPPRLPRTLPPLSSQSCVAIVGPLAEVVTDQGSECNGAFKDLLRQYFIQHCTTSANHPQAAEHAVQTIKTCLTRLVSHTQLAADDDWDQKMQRVARDLVSIQLVSAAPMGW
jgi:hypothetical protein